MIPASRNLNPAPQPVFITGFPGSGIRLLQAVAQFAWPIESTGRVDEISPEQVFTKINGHLLGQAGRDWRGFPVTDPTAPVFEPSSHVRDGLLAAGIFPSPTLVFTWPFWLEANPRARLIVSLRHPAEAMAALRTRHAALSEGDAIELWLTYARLILGAVADPRTILVHFDSIFERPQEEIERIAGPHPGVFHMDRARRTSWANGSAIPSQCASAYATLCEAAGPAFASLRDDPGFEARKDEYARSVTDAARWREAERYATLDRMAPVDREALAQAHLQARVAQERLLDIERSLVFKLTQLIWSLRDRLFPPGTRRRKFQGKLRSRLARVVHISGEFQEPMAQPLDGDEREYALYHKRVIVPGVGRRLPSIRVITIDDSSPLSPATADSVRLQSQPDWTWRVAGVPHSGVSALSALDPRIVIASESTDAFSQLISAVSDLDNEDTVVLLQNSASLHPLGLSKLVEAVQAEQAQAAYCDLDHVDVQGARIRPWFKPDWSPDLTLSVDLLGPVTAVRARHLNGHMLRGVPPALWLWRLALDLRSSGAKVVHVPHVLVHVPASPHPDPPSGASLISDALRAEGRQGVRVSEEGRLRTEWRPASELVSIVIPTKDKAEILAVCLETLLGRTGYRPFEVILVDTGSHERATERLYEGYRDRGGFSVVSDVGPFNFSRACNTGASAARGSRLLFLNNDTEIIHEDWLDRMAQWLDDPRVGAVGARLLYPDATLQHAGVVVGTGGLAGHLFHQQRKGVSGIFGPEHWYRNLSAVTGACLLTSRKAFESIGGFDETLELVYGDTDYCLRLRQIGLRIVYSPDAELVHHESQSRGKRVPRADFIRFTEKLLALGALDGDPYFNPGLSYQSTRPRPCLGAQDSPRLLNRQFMSRLADKPTIVVPDDLY